MEEEDSIQRMIIRPLNIVAVEDVFGSLRRYLDTFSCSQWLNWCWLQLGLFSTCHSVRTFTIEVERWVADVVDKLVTKIVLAHGLRPLRILLPWARLNAGQQAVSLISWCYPRLIRMLYSKAPTGLCGISFAWDFSLLCKSNRAFFT